MSSVKNILAGAALSFAALGFLGSTPAQAGVVVKSSGPSAETYPVGKKLDDAASVTLRTGDSITVLTGSGTRVISGPGTHRNPSQRSGGGQSALVMQRGMGVQLPTRQSCPTGQSASRTHSSRGTQRRSRGLQISPLGQSVSRPHPVATQRAS